MAGRARGSAVHAGLSIAAIAVATSAGTAGAQEPPAHGDARHGKAISYTCLGCHGNRRVMDDLRRQMDEAAENLEFERAADLRDRLKAAERVIEQEKLGYATLSDQDIGDIAAYFAGKPLVASGKAPGRVPQAATLCVSCHGQDGVAIAPMYPSLAGQHQDYLVRAIDEYRKGGRRNPVMKGFAATLKDEDIAVIAQYFSALTPSLSTESRPYTWLTAK